MNQKTSEPQLAHVRRDQVGNLTGTFSAATLDQKDTVDYAISAYGHLIKRNERVSLVDFADRIAAVYDEANPRNAVVIVELRAVVYATSGDAAIPA